MNSNYFSDNNNNSDIISNKKDQKYNQQYLQTSGEFMKNYDSIFSLTKGNNIYSNGKEDEKSFSNKYNQNLKTIDSNNSNIPKEENSSNITYNRNIYISQNGINKYEEKNDLGLKRIGTGPNGENNDINNNYIPEIFKNNKLIKNYKKWSGNNYFIFKGHMMEGPCSIRPTLLTFCAMTIPIILFLSFNSQFMKNEISAVIPFLIVFIYIITLIYLLVGSFSDPGIIRRFNFNNINDYKFKYLTRKEAKIFQLGYIINYKYCNTCGIMRPNRSTHCSDCNNCVERLDHHCPWIGNCAGKRNYLYFFIFLTLLNALSILIITFSIIHIVKRVKDLSDINDFRPQGKEIKHVKAYSFCEVIISLYLIIYYFLTMCFITGLLYYHIRLIINNITTKEELRKAFNNSQGNLYRRSFWKNVKNVLNPQTKKHNILEILRGDFTEICDIENGNESDNKNEEKKIIENETQDMLNINDIVENTNDQDNSTPLDEDYGHEGNISNNNTINKSIDIYNNYNGDFNTDRFSNGSNDINYEKNNISKSIFNNRTFSNQKVFYLEQNTEKKRLYAKSNQDDLNGLDFDNDKLKKLNLEKYLENFGKGNRKKSNNSYKNE